MSEHIVNCRQCQNLIRPGCGHGEGWHCKAMIDKGRPRRISIFDADTPEWCPIASAESPTRIRPDPSDPDNCFGCPHLAIVTSTSNSDSESWYCKRACNALIKADIMFAYHEPESRPTWCPIKATEESMNEVAAWKDAVWTSTREMTYHSEQLRLKVVAKDEPDGSRLYHIIDTETDSKLWDLSHDQACAIRDILDQVVLPNSEWRQGQ